MLHYTNTVIESPRHTITHVHAWYTHVHVRVHAYKHSTHKLSVTSNNMYIHVLVNVQAARRYRIYPRLFCIPDEGGARGRYAKQPRKISCMRREAVR